MKKMRMMLRVKKLMKMRLKLTMVGTMMKVRMRIKKMMLRWG